MYRIKPIIVLFESNLRGVTPLLKRSLFGDMGAGLNTGCWKLGRTYTVSPFAGLVISTFLQPGGNADIGYTVSWAAENALNVAIRVVVRFILPDHGPTQVTMTVPSGAITRTYTNLGISSGRKQLPSCR